MPYIEILNGPEVGQKVILSQDVFFIGRDSNNHLVLTDRTVSRKHAVVNLTEGQYVLSDLKSLKGILINGVKKDEGTLESGDEIAIGAVRLRFYGEGQRTMDNGQWTGERKKKKFRLWTGILVLSVILLGAVFYIWQGGNGQRSDMETLKGHYEQGLKLFNIQHDPEGAKGEWKKVLELDPKQETPYAQKAAKLLENLE